MSQENVALVQAAYDAFARGDGAAVLAAMDPGIVWNEAENFPYADGNPYVGPMAVAEGVFGRIGADWEGFHLVIETLLDAGGIVVALGRYRGRNKATRTELDAQFAHVWWLSAGKITRFQQYTDTYQARAAAGSL